MTESPFGSAKQFAEGERDGSQFVQPQHDATYKYLQGYASAAYRTYRNLNKKWLTHTFRLKSGVTRCIHCSTKRADMKHPLGACPAHPLRKEL